MLLTNRQYAFARFTQEQGLVVAVNNDEQTVNISIPVLFENKRYINLETGEQIPVEGGRICLSVKAAGSVFVEIKE